MALPFVFMFKHYDSFNPFDFRKFVIGGNLGFVVNIPIGLFGLLIICFMSDMPMNTLTVLFGSAIISFIELGIYFVLPILIVIDFIYVFWTLSNKNRLRDL